jgi:putative YphP/YqiW family bacilliredoxin
MVRCAGLLEVARMQYDETLVQPMRADLTRLGVLVLRSSADVDAFMARKAGTAMIVVNSVCGCAAGAARPAVQLALQGAVRPERVATVFAGQDLEATARARQYFPQFPPSSPSIALFKDGEVVYFVPRHRMEGRDAVAIAAELGAAFERYFAPAAAR